MSGHLSNLSIKEQFENDGFYISEKAVISENLVQAAFEGMDRVRGGKYQSGNPPCPSPWNPGDDPNSLCKIEMPQISDFAIRELISHPAIGSLAAELTGARMVQVWWVQLLYKPGHSTNKGTNIGWHQDQQYWDSWQQDSRLLTAWIALSDVTIESGPMRFLKGSHKWGPLDQGDFFGQDLSELERKIRSDSNRTWDEVPAVMKPGSISFHDKLTLHGSGPNSSGGPRRSFAVHLRTERSRPVQMQDTIGTLLEFIDNHTYCPVIYSA